MKISFIPSARRLIEERKDVLYAADVYVPEKLYQRCRLAALTFIFLFSGLTFLMPFQQLNYLSAKTGLLKPQTIQIAAFLAGFASYPKLLKFFFDLSIKLKLTEKRERINRNLYTALCMLSGFGKGGLPAARAVELIAKSNLDGIREEFAKIHTSVSILGYDLRTAALRVALTTPSDRLAHFLKGFVSFLERSRNYGNYVEEYLQLDNVNRRIELTAYAEKLRQLSVVYVTLVTILSSLSIITLSISMAEPGKDYSDLVIYFGLPAVCAAMTVLYYIGCPEKETERVKKREATYLSTLILITGILAAYIPLSNLKPFLLIAAMVSAIIAHIYVRKALKADSEVEQELNTLLMSLYASSRSGESVVSALRSASGELANRLAGVVASSAIRPVGETLSEESRKATHPFLSALLYVLGNVVHSTKRFSDVLTALIYEYHRYIEYTKLKKSVANATAILVLMALTLTAFCMGIVKVQMIPTMEKAIEKAGGHIAFNPEHAKRIANDAVIVLSATTPFTLGSITWDFRRSFKFYVGTYALAFLFIFLT